MKHTALTYINEWMNKTGRAASDIYVPEAIRPARTWVTYCGHPASGARLQHTEDGNLWQVTVDNRVTFGPTADERAANAAYDRAYYAVVREV